ncbi:MAG: flagellar protein FlgN [Deltaproteobacteria bacterium]
MKQEIVENFIQMLEAEHKIYEEILKLSKDKTQIIIEGKVSELDHIVKLEQAFVLQISKVEKSRNEFFLKFSQEINLNKKTWNVTELKKIASPEQVKRLEKYQQGMTGILSELAQVNQLNSKLISNSLEFIEFSLNIMSSADIASNNYGNNGDTLNKEKKNRFDIRL